MEHSFYHNLVIIIGILVAIASLLQFGIKKSIIPIVFDIVIVIVLLALITKTAREDFRDQEAANPQTNQSAPKSKWQIQHDQWWQRYKQRVQENPRVYLPDQGEIKARINGLQRQLILAKNQKSRLAIKHISPSNLSIVRLNQKIDQIKKHLTTLQLQLR